MSPFQSSLYLNNLFIHATIKTKPLRIQTIQTEKGLLSQQIQQPQPWAVEDPFRAGFSLKMKGSLRARGIQWLAPHVLRLQQPAIRKQIGFTPSFPYDLLCLGERFSHGAALSVLLQKIRSEDVRRVLVPGCNLGGEEVQFWLRRGIKKMAGIDVAYAEKAWAQVIPLLQEKFHAEVDFRPASVEKLPFEDASFDLIASAAVLEHVHNLPEAISEMARVLRPGGWAWHGLGPFYYTFGGDHCIGSYGPEAGYHHLLLEDPAYQKLIRDDKFFSTQPDPNCRYWALSKQFSFAKPSEYFLLFSTHFEIQHLVVIISEEGAAFRQKYPQRWKELLQAEILEEDLLIKTFRILLRKPMAS